MLNNLTLEKSGKEIGIDLKTSFRWHHCFFISAATAKINALSGIVEVKETFFLDPLNGNVIPHRKPRKSGKGGNKKKKRIAVLIA
ncbi:MAG: hypothetical protein ACTS73_09635 [Arsenophonus sp. NEOnobi-MAG3]